MLGGGRIAREHLRVLTNHPECEVAVLCDRNPAVLQEVGDAFGIAGRSQSVEEVAGRKDLDAVFVAVSVPAAPKAISLFLEAGIPTFMEKPPGLYSAETAHLVELGERRSAIAMVGLNRRFYANHLATHEWLAAHGPLRTVSLEAHEDLANQPAKHGPEMMRRVLYHNGIHVLDLLRFFGGEVIDVTSRVACVEHPYPDCFTATLRFANGAHGRVGVDHFAPGRNHFELGMIGARATAGPGLNSTELTSRSESPILAELDDDDRRFKAGLWKQDSAFLAGVRAGRQPRWPAASLRDAYQTMLLIDRISHSPAERVEGSIDALRRVATN